MDTVAALALLAGSNPPPPRRQRGKPCANLDRCGEIKAQGSLIGLCRKQQFVNRDSSGLDTCWGGDGNTVNASHHQKQEGNETVWKSLQERLYVNLK